MKLRILLLIICILFLSGCNSVEYEPFSFCQSNYDSCHECGKMFNAFGPDNVFGTRTVLINSEEEYFNAIENFKNKLHEENKVLCKNNNLPSIDFSKYTLLSNYASSGSNTKFEIKVKRNDFRKRVVFSINKKNLGKSNEFRPVLTSTNPLILVSKIPEDYKVIFK